MWASQHPYLIEYELQFEAHADTRGPGGAVTVALCGSWDHEGPCRWPHVSTIREVHGERHRLLVEFHCSDNDLTHVRTLIHNAVSGGQQVGPDGDLSEWRMISETAADEVHT